MAFADLRSVDAIGVGHPTGGAFFSTTVATIVMDQLQLSYKKWLYKSFVVVIFVKKCNIKFNN